MGGNGVLIPSWVVVDSTVRAWAWDFISVVMWFAANESASGFLPT